MVGAVPGVLACVTLPAPSRSRGVGGRPALPSGREKASQSGPGPAEAAGVAGAAVGVEGWGGGEAGPEV
ncbi:hypothetical protein GCM10010383_60510 [Streptomyces lomondensis]|uniref:Uncharacterized protein n=1 Tax=Streptomyces lomondensis TaxID=68229 RepID=A0ABQ2XLK9_9ACTN|nr:hypothetical protein GCM10010383_60510 [Streptomyces lomondensis]